MKLLIMQSSAASFLDSDTLSPHALLVWESTKY